MEDLRYSRLDSEKPRVDRLLKDHHIELDKKHAVYRQLCKISLKALAEIYKNAEIIVKGDFDNPALVFDQLPPGVSETEPTTLVPKGLTFDEAISKYLIDNKASWSDKNLKSHQTKIAYFLEFAAEEDGVTTQRTLASVTSALVRTYKELLQITPSNAKKRYPALSPRQSAVQGQTDNVACLGLTSQANYIQSISSLYSFATKELDYTGPNPFKGRSNAKTAKKNQRDQRHPFSREQLRALFTSPLYSGCQSLASCHRPGGQVPKESHKYWVPLIGLYTGMRMQEILQLYVTDIYPSNGIWVFDLNESHEDKRLKTPQSKRLVPIHSDLIEYGLLEFADSKPSGRLFEDAPSSNDGTYSSTFSKWFSRYLTNIGIKTNKTSFHSLRHNMKDFFRAVGESDELAENFMGRSTGSTGEAYGSGFSTQRYQQALHKIDFKELLERR